MIKALTIAAAVCTLASTASAKDIKVSLVGKDEATIHADIKRAAKTVCRDLYYGPLASYEAANCVSRTVTATERKIREAMVTPAAPERLASVR